MRTLLKVANSSDDYIVIDTDMHDVDRFADRIKEGKHSHINVLNTYLMDQLDLLDQITCLICDQKGQNADIISFGFGILEPICEESIYASNQNWDDMSIGPDMNIFDNNKSDPLIQQSVDLGAFTCIQKK